jgi:predicted tellurium resistance membrane protein TerC
MDITEIIVSLLTLTLLEVVLGVDNLVFIAIVSNKLPLAKQAKARRFGLLFALVTRLLLLASVNWLARLKMTVFSLNDFSFSIRDLLLMGGGLFLIYKGTIQIHEEVEPPERTGPKRFYAKLGAVIIQIGLFDIIFSIDSVFTAVGLTTQYWIMATAITICIFAMIAASEPLSRFIERHPTVKVLALSFLLLIGMMLIADGFQVHIPRAYVYFAICYAVFVEALNSWVRLKRAKH